MQPILASSVENLPPRNSGRPKLRIVVGRECPQSSVLEFGELNLSPSLALLYTTKAVGIHPQSMPKASHPTPPLPTVAVMWYYRTINSGVIVQCPREEAGMCFPIASFKLITLKRGTVLQHRANLIIHLLLTFAQALEEGQYP